ncbi:MAG: dTDP-4-dehydrorhamnose 3,5-epimerase [Chthoniobacterales bacterium]|nr:dTDP-4-dehydrorhamnose 3,5-epimerase [Chthoniobacterales bacterium]
MIFTKTPLAGACVIDLDRHRDARGFFARSFCQREFAAHGLNREIRQCNLSFNHKAGTLRGLHFQKAPGAEAKLIRCVRGAIHDVIIDLRPASETYGQHFAVTLDAGRRRALFVPESFAHGFQTLEDESEVEYQMTNFYAPEYAAGYRYDDRAFAIVWPLPVSVISEPDLAWPPFVP